MNPASATASVLTARHQTPAPAPAGHSAGSRAARRVGSSRQRSRPQPRQLRSPSRNRWLAVPSVGGSTTHPARPPLLPGQRSRRSPTRPPGLPSSSPAGRSGPDRPAVPPTSRYRAASAWSPATALADPSSRPVRRSIQDSTGITISVPAAGHVHHDAQRRSRRGGHSVG